MKFDFKLMYLDSTLYSMRSSDNAPRNDICTARDNIHFPGVRKGGKGEGPEGT